MWHPLVLQLLSQPCGLSLRALFGEKNGCFQEIASCPSWGVAMLPGHLSPRVSFWGWRCHIPVSPSDPAGGPVPQGHGLAVAGPPPNACPSNCKGNQEKLEIKERKELIRILAQPQWLCFRRADTTRSLMPVLRGLRKEVGFGRCSGAFLVDFRALLAFCPSRCHPLHPAAGPSQALLRRSASTAAVTQCPRGVEILGG